MAEPKLSTLVAVPEPEGHRISPHGVPLAPQWRKGQSGNPSGKPKGALSVSQCVEMILRGRTKPPRESVRVPWNIALNLVNRARQNDASLLILLDRTEGKVLQPVEQRHVVDINRAIADAHAAALLEGIPEEPTG